MVQSLWATLRRMNPTTEPTLEFANQLPTEAWQRLARLNAIHSTPAVACEEIHFAGGCAMLT